MKNHCFDQDDQDVTVPKTDADSISADPGQESYTDPRIGEGQTEGEQSVI